MARIVAYLNVDAPIPLQRNYARTSTVAVAAVAALGVWRQRGVAVHTKNYQIPIVPDKPYATMGQHAVRIDDGHAAEIIQPGSYAIYVAHGDARAELIDHDIVYVIRQREGDLVEHTVRRVVFEGKRIFLDTMPLINEVDRIAYPSPGVEIVGLCIGQYGKL